MTQGLHFLTWVLHQQLGLRPWVEPYFALVILGASWGTPRYSGRDLWWDMVLWLCRVAHLRRPQPRPFLLDWAPAWALTLALAHGRMPTWTYYLRQAHAGQVHVGIRVRGDGSEEWVRSRCGLSIRWDLPHYSWQRMVWQEVPIDPDIWCKRCMREALIQNQRSSSRLIESI